MKLPSLAVLNWRPFGPSPVTSGVVGGRVGDQDSWQRWWGQRVMVTVT